jgi:O-antigen/teichoic acid export membrane protein
MVITYPLALRHLGEQRFGIWLTLTSFTSIVAFSDLGIGNGLMTALSKARGEGDHRQTESLVSSGFFMLLGTAAVIGVAFGLVTPSVDWVGVFNASPEVAPREVSGAVMIFAFAFLVGLPLATVEKAEWALQEGYLAGLWNTAGAILGSAGIIAVIFAGGGLAGFSLAFFGFPVIALLANGLWTFRQRHPELMPARRRVNAEATATLLKLGGLFFTLQLVAALAFTSDNLIVARILGPEQVPQLAVPARMYSFLTVAAGLVFMPLWPAYGESLGGGDFQWVKATFRRSLIGAFTFSLAGSLALIFFGPTLLRIWMGPTIRPSLLLLVGLALWTVMASTGTAVAMLYNAAGVVRFQVVAASMMAISAIALKIYLGHRFGIEGVVWATVISYLVFVVIPSIAVLPRLIRRLEEQTAPAAGTPNG